MNTLLGAFICSGRTKGSGFKLTKSMFISDKKEQFSDMWLVGHWNMLSRKDVDAPFLEVFKTRLDGSLKKPV